jgi:hypothetical protein
VGIGERRNQTLFDAARCARADGPERMRRGRTVPWRFVAECSQQPSDRLAMIDGCESVDCRAPHVFMFVLQGAENTVRRRIEPRQGHHPYRTFTDVPVGVAEARGDERLESGGIDRCHRRDDFVAYWRARR